MYPQAKIVRIGKKEINIPFKDFFKDCKVKKIVQTDEQMGAILETEGKGQKQERMK